MRDLKFWQHRIFAAAALLIFMYGISEHARQRAHERTRHDHLIEIRHELADLKEKLDKTAQEQTAERIEYKMESLAERVDDLRKTAKDLCEVEYDRGFDEAMDVVDEASYDEPGC